MFPVVCEKSAPFPAVKSKIKNQKSKIKNKIFFQSDFPVQPPRCQKVKTERIASINKISGARKRGV